MTRYILLLAGAGLWTGAAYVSEVSPMPETAEVVAGMSTETGATSASAEATETGATSASAEAALPPSGPPETLVEPEPEPELPRRLVIPFAPGYITFEVPSIAADIAEFTSHAKTDLDCLVAVRVYSAPEEVGPRAAFLANRRLELVRGVVLGEGMPERRVQIDPNPETQSPDGVFAHVELERVGDCQ